MGMTVIPSPANLQGPVKITGDVTATNGVMGSFLQTGSGGQAQMAAENGGGFLHLLKANAGDANPGASIAKVYLRDGTVGGTLKLVVIAGAAGVETTILDNISQ